MLHVLVQYGTEEHSLTENEKTLYYRDLYRKRENSILQGFVLYSKILLSSVHKGNKEHEVCEQHPETCSRF